MAASLRSSVSASTTAERRSRSTRFMYAQMTRYSDSDSPAISAVASTCYGAQRARRTCAPAAHAGTGARRCRCGLPSQEAEAGPRVTTRPSRRPSHCFALRAKLRHREIVPDPTHCPIIRPRGMRAACACRDQRTSSPQHAHARAPQLRGVHAHAHLGTVRAQLLLYHQRGELGRNVAYERAGRLLHASLRALRASAPGPSGRSARLALLGMEQPTVHGPAPDSCSLWSGWPTASFWSGTSPSRTESKSLGSALRFCSLSIFHIRFASAMGLLDALAAFFNMSIGVGGEKPLLLAI